MSLTLKDLRVVSICPQCRGHGLTHGYNCGLCRGSGKVDQSASLADLVEVLKQEGAWEMESYETVDAGEYAVDANGPGRYLVLPLGDTP